MFRDICEGQHRFHVEEMIQVEGVPNRIIIPAICTQCGELKQHIIRIEGGTFVRDAREDSASEGLVTSGLPGGLSSRPTHRPSQ